MKLKPADGLLIRDPASKRLLPAEGAEVPPTNFWQRRLAAGDVTIVKEPAPAKEPTK
jgi:hypothetical protein